MTSIRINDVTRLLSEWIECNGKISSRIKGLRRKQKYLHLIGSHKVVKVFLLFFAILTVLAVWPVIAIEQGQLLISAAMSGRVDQVEDLLAQGVDVNVKNPAGRSALHLAAFNGNILTIRALLAAGADVNQTDQRGVTCLMDASAFGHIDVVELLIQAGADVNAKDQQSNTALSLSAKGGNDEIVEILRAAGAEEQVEDETTAGDKKK